jgi:DNA-directed RNA polymerase subunit RPC12/RpoP
MVVYTPTTDGYRDVAERVAADRGTGVVDNLDAVDPSEQVVLVDDPAAIGDRRLYDLQRRMLASSGEAGDFSVVTGHTPELAETLYEREKSSTGANFVYLSGSNQNLREPSNDYLPDETLSVYLHKSATVERLRDEQTERLQSLSLIAPGKNAHIILDDGYICGFPRNPSEHDFSARQPACVEDGEEACPFDENLVHAENVNADHVFTASCMSTVNNNHSGLPVHVGLGLLSSVTSLIGSYRMSAGVSAEPLLHYALLQSGCGVAERCRYLNRNAHACNLKASPYVPFGRPEAGAADVPDGESSVAIHDDRASGVRVELTDIDAPFVEFTLPKEYLGDADSYYVWAADEAQSLPLYYFVDDVPGTDGLTVVLYGGGRIRTEYLPVVVDTTPARADDRRALLASLENAKGLERIGVSNQKSTAQVENLQHEIQNLANTANRETFDVLAHEELVDDLDRALHDARRVDDQLYEVLKGTVVPPKLYGDRVIEQDTFVAADDCRACGHRVFAKEVSDVTGAVRRAVGQCARCGLVFDVPTTPGDDDPSRPVIEENFVDDDPASATVRFRNDREYAMHGTVRYALLNFADSLRTDRFEPASVEFSLSPGEERTFECTFDTSDLPENLYNFVVYVFGNDDVYVGSHPVLKGDQVGFMI